MSKKKMVLRELDDALSFVRNKLDALGDDVENENYLLLCKQLRALEEIDNFVSDYAWVGKQESVKERVRFIRESGYDYDFVRRELNMSADALKSLVTRTNKRLTECIGDGTIDMIISRNETVSLGLIRFRICSGRYSMADILISDFYKSMPEGKIDFYDIFECEEEIKLMYLFSNWGMQEAIAKCDMNKLAFLMYITQNSVERYAEEQKDLISLFQGINIGFDDYMEKLAALRDEKMRDSDYYLGRLNNFSFGEDDDENYSDEVVDDSFVDESATPSDDGFVIDFDGEFPEVNSLDDSPFSGIEPPRIFEDEEDEEEELESF